MTSASTFKLGLRNQKPEKKLQVCQGFLDGLGKLPPAEREALMWPALQEKCAEMDQTLKDIRVLRAQLRATFSRRTKVMREMCQAAEITSGLYGLSVKYDPVRVLAGGLALRRARHSTGVPAAPSLFRAARGSYEGSVMLRWKRPLRRCVFIVEATTDPEGQSGWKTMTHCTTEKCLVEKLISGKIHWFRVAAVNSHGQGAWSIIIALRPG